MIANPMPTNLFKKDGVFATVNGIEISDVLWIERGYAAGTFAKVLAVKKNWIGTYRYVRGMHRPGWVDCGPWVMAPGAVVTVEFLDGPFEGRKQTYTVCQNDDGLVCEYMENEAFKIVEKVTENGAVTYRY